jgi:hypothetical protein
MQSKDEFISGFREGIHNSMPGEIYFPIIAAAIPAFLFMLLGFLGEGLEEKPGIEPTVWVIVSMVVVQVLGITSMAFVLLVRFEISSCALFFSTHGQPRAWRRCSLFLSIACLLIFDILTNLAAAFTDAAAFLVVCAVPVFFAYVVCNRIAFAGLGRLGQSSR